MTLPDPFVYRAEIHERVHGPEGYREYAAYKPWLRDEFAFRCVYCLEREAWYPDRAASFSADHAEPKSARPDLTLDYGNLLYACTRCNSAKGDRTGFLDPTRSAMADHLRVEPDGGDGRSHA